MSGLTKLAGVISALSLLLACNNTGFQGGSAKKPAKEPSKQPEKPADVTKISDDTTVESFGIDSKEKSKIDMVWVIDNSGSMYEEAAQVKKNLELFIKGLSQHNNVKMALMSGSEQNFPRTGVTLSDEAKQAGHIQLEGDDSRYSGGIGSTNALAAVAAAVGATPKLDPSDEFADEFAFGFETDGLTAYKDKLKDFFRDGAKSVFVIVSDDNAYGVNETNFLDALKGKIKDEQPSVYGFVGTNESTCGIAQRGRAYEALAQTTKGQVYDLCKEDWQEHFSKLTDHVETSVVSEYVLKSSNIQSIKSVELDGVALSKDQYSLDGQKLVIKEGVLATTNKTLKVTLAVKP